MRGAHNVISAVSLPTSVPEDIVHDMNMKFRMQLRDALNKFINDNSLVWNRTQSTTSKRLFLESLQEQMNLTMVEPNYVLQVEDEVSADEEVLSVGEQ